MKKNTAMKEQRVDNDIHPVGGGVAHAIMQDQTRKPRLSKEEHARRGTKIYERDVYPLVAAQRGKIVAIDVDTGLFEVADDTLAACARLFARRPKAQTWCVRIGYRGVHRFGAAR